MLLCVACGKEALELPETQRAIHKRPANHSPEGVCSTCGERTKRTANDSWICGDHR